MRRQVARVAVPTYLYGLITEVQERTGYPIQLTEEPALGYDSMTRFATPERPFHECSYVPEYRDFALHFFTTSIFKVLRFFQLPPEERYVPASPVDRRLPDDDHAELLRRIPPGSGVDPELLSRFLYTGTVRQLISVPGDMRVEREIDEQISEHCKDQRDYLARQIHDLEAHFSPEIAAFAPPRVYRATSAMNVVLAEVASDIAGLEFPTYVRSSPHRGMGHALRARLDAEEEPGYRGDRRVTDRWTEELEMEGWFEWVRFSSIQPDR